MIFQKGHINSVSYSCANPRMDRDYILDSYYICNQLFFGSRSLFALNFVFCCVGSSSALILDHSKTLLEERKYAKK